MFCREILFILEELMNYPFYQINVSFPIGNFLFFNHIRLKCFIHRLFCEVKKIICSKKKQLTKEIRKNELYVDDSSSETNLPCPVFSPEFFTFYQGKETKK